MKGLKKVFGVLFCLTFIFTGCGSTYDGAKSDYANGGGYYEAPGSVNSAGIYGEDSDYFYEPSDSYEGSYDSPSAGAGEDVRAGRKLIRTVSLKVETMDFDALLSYVQSRTQELGGYVEKLNSDNGSSYYGTNYSGSGYRNERNASLTLRIPKSNLDIFLSQVAENGNITSRSEQETDVTLDYVDLDSHKDVLLAEQERLLSFLEQAETVEEMIMLESRLSEVRYQIESMERQLRTYDNQIEYSTVYLNITEVVELTPVPVRQQTTWERIGDGFMTSLKNIGKGFREFFVWFVTALPYLVLLAVIILLITVFTVLGVKRGAAKRRKRAEEYRQRQQAYMRQMQAQGMPPAPAAAHMQNMAAMQARQPAVQQGQAAQNAAPMPAVQQGQAAQNGAPMPAVQQGQAAQNAASAPAVQQGGTNE